MDADPRDLLDEYLSALNEIPEARDLIVDLRAELASGKLVVIDNVGSKSESRAPWSDVTHDERKTGRMVASEPLTVEESLQALSSVMRRLVVDPGLIVRELQAAEVDDPLAPLAEGITFASPETEVIREDIGAEDTVSTTGPALTTVDALSTEETSALRRLQALLTDLDRAITGERDG